MGEFHGKANFDDFVIETPSFEHPGRTSNKSDIFLAKYNAQGKTEWVHSFFGLLEEEKFLKLTSNNEPIIAGDFNDSIYFNNKGFSAKNKELAGARNYLSYFAKYNSDGKPQWINTIDAPINDIFINSNGNFIISGVFITPIAINGKKYQANDLYEKAIYFAEYAPKGNFVDYHQLDSIPGYPSDLNLKILKNNKFLVWGSFKWDITLADTTYQDHGTKRDGFLAMLDQKTGKAKWAKHFKSDNIYRFRNSLELTIDKGGENLFFKSSG